MPTGPRPPPFRRAPHAILALAIVLFGAVPSTATDALLLRISVENVPEHFQARMVRRFSELVARGSNGSLIVEFYDSAKLYRDSDVVTALARGDVEMAVPGIWQFDRSVPATAALMLPSTFGRNGKTMRALVDGPFGRAVDSRISAALSCVVIGNWLDLGGVAVFSRTKPIRTADDFVGLKVRVAGGRGNEERMRELGALPVSISSPDLPSFLDRGLVDAVLSTWETIASAGLDAHGLKYAFADDEYYPFYIPIVNAAFWNRLTEAQRRLITDTWAELLPEARATAVGAQVSARTTLEKRGLVVEVPAAKTIDAMRSSLLAQEGPMASRLGVPSDMLTMLERELADMTSGTDD